MKFETATWSVTGGKRLKGGESLSLMASYSVEVAQDITQSSRFCCKVVNKY